MKNQKDILERLADIQKTLLSQRPSIGQMWEELRMMRFKVRPTSGDIYQVNLNDTRFVEILWNLGKLDELFQREVKLIDKSEREIFYRFFDDTYRRFQDMLNQLNLRKPFQIRTPSFLKMEIFRESKRKRKSN
ncbi:hypothetical protein COS12_01035 [Candidatus Roizmanbacteria bacterium CG01_land_8_20_14_3_00_33_9]|uniref:Uncharacterized protein n=1 Tax=Candidatus Roizmanbacteria bacterium CG01_land_8_20_14_3_00_33_9 TaxID=1974843 RepID=A0A2M7E4Y1_9BACT|nr:MAG: hypothetical protein COS12_01035 [Candidatus Roizmanbacteria bacterium CG01_land_8_20_14_3_00_33_9]